MTEESVLGDLQRLVSYEGPEDRRERPPKKVGNRRSAFWSRRGLCGTPGRFCRDFPSWEANLLSSP